MKRVPSIAEHVDLLNPFNLQHKCREVLLKGAEVVEHDIADSPFIPPQQCDTDVFLDPLDGNDKEDFYFFNIATVNWDFCHFPLVLLD